MRAQQHIESDQSRKEVASLLLPLADKLLLLPHAAVAEIVPVGQTSGVADAPEWLLGEFIWREQAVPLISFELINAGNRPTVGSRSRIAVLNATGVSEELGFIAVLTQGLPRLARVTPDELSIMQDVERQPFDKLSVVWAGEQATIPDISKLEQAYLEYCKAGV